MTCILASDWSISPHSLFSLVRDLDLGGAASSYGLLKMPRMPELKGIKIDNFTEVRMDMNSVAYKDKVRDSLFSLVT